MAKPREPEKATELLTLIALLHNCHRASGIEIIFRFGDLIVTPRDSTDTPTGLHMNGEIILFRSRKEPMVSIYPTINYFAKNDNSEAVVCRSPHIELKYWKEIEVALSYTVNKSIVHSYIDNENLTYKIFPKYSGPDYLLKIPKEIMWKKNRSVLLWGDGKTTFELQEMLVEYEYSFNWDSKVAGLSIKEIEK